jgi:hypothetical protein
MRKEVVFTKDGEVFMSLDPPGAHVFGRDKFSIIVDVDEVDGESLEEYTDRCIDQAIKQLIMRYFNLRSYMGK